MKKNNILAIFIIIAVLSTFLMLPGAVRAQDYTSTIDYSQKTKKIWGIAACTVNTDGSVTLVDSTTTGYGYALWIPNGTGGYLPEVTLRPGESFDLIDGHHAFITNTFLGITDEGISIDITDKFDARSFGGEIKEQRAIVTIEPYADTD